MKENPHYLAAPILSLQTMLRRIAITNSSILPLVPDGFYGANTYASVKSFQKHYNLPETGNTDYTTWIRIVQEYNALAPISNSLPLPEKPTYDSTAEIYLIQAMLLALSQQYVSIRQLSLTGVLDNTTTNTLKQIQQISGIERTGLPDRLTLLSIWGILMNSLL